MNKEMFIKELEKVTEFSEEKCRAINSIIEDTFIVGKTNKEKMIKKFEEQLEMTKEEAEKLYEKAMSIITKAIRDKIKNPFK